MMLDVPVLKVPLGVRRLLGLLMGFGLLVFVLGLWITPERIWPNFLIAEYYLMSLGLGASFLIAVLYVTNAGWGVAFRRIPEAITSTLVAAAVGAVVLIPGIHHLYHWSHQDAVAEDAILQAKSAWLNQEFFILRLALYFLVWIFMSRVIVRNSVRQDLDGDLVYTHRNVRNSAIFIIVGGYTTCLAAIDLLMSLQPHWYSTVFAWMSLAGMFLSGLAIVVVFLVILRKMGYDNVFTTDHLHDLGKLMHGFCFFWVYMWVSQHMLIWYSNIPEETTYYIFRHFGGWGSLSFLNVLLNWLIPFILLLPRVNKRDDKVMMQMAIVILVGRWLDLYIMVMPATFGAEPLLGIWEIGPMVGVLALFFWIVFRALGKRKLVPTRDPYLCESLPQG
ncbi:MAG: hypothetical protein V3R94_03810 [Acidobacteriota bacterium]